MTSFPHLSFSRAGYLWLGFYGAVLLAWFGLFRMIRGSDAAILGDMPADFWASLCIAAGNSGLGALIAMWSLMSAAMMLPTFVPTLRTYLHLSDAGAGSTGGAMALVLGYVIVWLGAAVLGATAQWALSRAGLMSPAGQSISGGLTSALLIGAGLYQFSSFKEACLAKCRMPLTFFMEHWQPGSGRALRMGLQLGVFCLGCCWALMALGFVGGTMNLLWMGAATLFMALEKLPDIGRVLTRPTGWLLLIAGGLMLLRTLI